MELPFVGQAFTEAWNDYVQHRTESRHKLTPTATKLLLKKLARWGEERATAALIHSTENGWRGVFEPPGARTGNLAQQIMDEGLAFIAGGEDE